MATCPLHYERGPNNYAYTHTYTRAPVRRAGFVTSRAHAAGAYAMVRVRAPLSHLRRAPQLGCLRPRRSNRSRPRLRPSRHRTAWLGCVSPAVRVHQIACVPAYVCSLTHALRAHACSRRARPAPLQPLAVEVCSAASASAGWRLLSSFFFFTALIDGVWTRDRGRPEAFQEAVSGAPRDGGRRRWHRCVCACPCVCPRVCVCVVCARACVRDTARGVISHVPAPARSAAQLPPWRRRSADRAHGGSPDWARGRPPLRLWRPQHVGLR